MATGGPRASYARRGDRPIAQAFVERLQARLAERHGSGAFRLRFDRVALRFIADVQRGLHDVVPEGRTAIVTITAPLRQPSKTATQLVDDVRPLCARAGVKTDLHVHLYDNAIAVRIARGSAGTENVLVLVHNPHPDAAALLDAAQALLA